MKTRQNHCALLAGRSEHRPVACLLKLFEHVSVRFRRNVGHIAGGESLVGERWRLHRERLRRGGALAGHAGLGRRPLLNREQRLAGLAVEHEDVPRLGHLGDRIDTRAIALHADEVGQARQIVIPKVVVDHLEMPKAFPCRSIERDHRISEDVVPEPLAAVEIECRRPGGDEDDAAFIINAHAAPVVRGAGGLPRVALPGLVAELTGMRDGVEDPCALARAYIKCADVAGRGETRAFADAAADDDQVLPDDTGRSERVEGTGRVAIEAAREVDGAVLSESGIGFAGFRVERVEPHAGAEEHALLAAAAPVGDAPADAPATLIVGVLKRIEAPQLAAGGSIDRDGFE